MSTRPRFFIHDEQFEPLRHSRLSSARFSPTSNLPFPALPPISLGPLPPLPNVPVPALVPPWDELEEYLKQTSAPTSHRRSRTSSMTTLNWASLIGSPPSPRISKLNLPSVEELDITEADSLLEEGMRGEAADKKGDSNKLVHRLAEGQLKRPTHKAIHMMQIPSISFQHVPKTPKRKESRLGSGPRSHLLNQRPKSPGYRDEWPTFTSVMSVILCAAISSRPMVTLTA